MFLLAVIVYGEPFTATQGWTFLMIWTALAIYSIDSLRAYRRLG
jgi:chloramphenicol-sensitive protein RarD